MNISLYLFIALLAVGASLFSLFAGRSRVLRAQGAVRLSSRTADYLFYAAAFAYVFTFSALSALRHLSFKTDGYDMAIFDQAVWNSVRGRLLETSILPDITMLPSQHFSPILLALVPLYSVWSSPIVLLVTQTIAIALGAFPLYWFARQYVGRLVSLAIALAYFLSPALEGVNLAQFHEIAFSIPFLSLAAFFMLRSRYVPCLVCLALCLLVKEEMAFIVAGFGLYMLIVQRQWRIGSGVALAGIAWAILLLQYIIPYFNGAPFGSGKYYYFGAGLAAGLGRYDYLGRSLLEIVQTIATRPLLVLQHVVTAPKIEYVLQLIAPLAFLSLLGAEVSALALPTLGMSLLSDYAPQFSINFHYSAPFLPLIFFGAVVGMERITRWGHRSRTDKVGQPRAEVSLTVLLLVASGVCYYNLAPGPVSLRFDRSLYAYTEHAAVGHSLIAMIPPDAVVVTQTMILPFLSERPAIHGFPVIPNYCRAEYLLADMTQYEYHLFENDWDDWFATGYFDVIARQDGFLLARRRMPDHRLEVRFEDNVMLQSYMLPAVDQFRGGGPYCSLIRWESEKDSQSRYVLQTQLWDSRGHLIAQDPLDVEAGSVAAIKSVTGQEVEEISSMDIRSSVPAGVYDVTVSVFDSLAHRYLSARDASGQSLGTDVLLSKLSVQKDKSSKSANQLQVEHPFFVDMNEIRLLGYFNLPSNVHPGETLALGVYWRARGKPRGDYEVIVRLLDSNNHVVIEQASRPAAGTYPTTEWDVGEVLLDWHDLDVPSQIPAGDYSLMVELRDVSSKEILGQAPVNTVTVGE
jgi:uncharacterized membrane protein